MSGLPVKRRWQRRVIEVTASRMIRRLPLAAVRGPLLLLLLFIHWLFFDADDVISAVRMLDRIVRMQLRVVCG